MTTSKKPSRARMRWIKEVQRLARRSSKDMRAASGDGHFLSKLTRKKVEAMRSSWRGGVPISDLAARYGVSYRTAWAAVTGRTWRDDQ